MCMFNIILDLGPYVSGFIWLPLSALTHSTRCLDGYALMKKRITGKTSYTICGEQYQIKMWGPCFKIIKDFETVTVEH